MDDLHRTVLQGPALARCEQCQFCVDGVWPEQAGKRARRHTRETTHVTVVRYEHTTEYRPDTRGGSDA
jgi:hypothetical protein